LQDPKHWRAALAIILLTAFALRVLQVEHKPLWWDEGNSVYFAHQDLRTVISDSRTTNDTDPPAYRLALGVWKAFAGSSPFALRFFSGWLGVLAVALTWTLGTWLTGERAALAAGLFVALAPMQVYYAREGKGYVFAMVCALLSTYAWGKELGYASGTPSKHKSIWWAVYVLSTTVAVATHYYLAPLVLWQGLWVIGSTASALVRGTRARREYLTGLGDWIIAAILMALLLLPWVVLMLGTTVRGVTGLATETGLSLWTFLERTGAEFVVGPEAMVSATWLAGFAALVILGALVKAETGLFASTWVIVPLLAAYLIQRAYPFFYPRFLLYIGPACYLLASRAIETVSERLSSAVALATILVILIACVPWLVHIYAAPLELAEDPRPAIARIQSLAQPDDALVYVYIWQVGYLLSYYPHNTLSLYRAYYTPQSVEPELERVFLQHSRLWLLSYRTAAEDSYSLSASWLEANAFKVESAWYGQHNLALYLAPNFRTAGVGPDEGVATFDQRIELHYPLVRARLHPGDVIALPLRWRALAVPEEDFTVFAHLGLAGAPPLAQCDGPPQNAKGPTHTWAVGEEILDRRVITLPKELTEGRYSILVGLYRPTNGSRVPIDDTEGGDAVTLGYLQVER
jgi:uncharacterized membrane protein